MNYRLTILLLSATLPFAQPAFAQPAFTQPAFTQPAFAQPADQAARDKKSMEAMTLVASAVGSSRLVTGKPFQAQSITETVQTLADGTRIVRHNITNYYRDRSGRTRREQTIETLGASTPATPVHLVAISDPVARIDYILDSARQTARAFSRIDMPFPRTTERREATRKDLGARTIEGLECAGTRETITVPAGQIGNDRPIVSVTETWYSAAIEATVLYTTSDPRSGETTYALHNIVLAEPPHALFEPPAGYTVEPAGRTAEKIKPEEN